MPEKKIAQSHCTLGCDPEIFIRSLKTDRIVGSEKVIPEKGITSKQVSGLSDYSPTKGTIERDGVQAEIHPGSADCTTIVNNNVAYSIFKFDEWLRKEHDCRLDFTQTIKLTKEELAELSKESRILGCQPSLNIYDKEAIVGAPQNYPYRSAGG